MAGLRTRTLKKAYGDTVVLTGIELEVNDGEYVVLVGPSGCGKSTLLRCIAGLEVITEGDLFIGDRRVNDLAPRERDVAMVFQSYALYPHMTVRQNMGFALKIRGDQPKAIAEAVDRAATMLDLSALLDRYPSQLSGGQRQRVAMGRAIVRRPAVFLFDEPLSNLDPALRDHMRVELKRLHRQLETTVVHVTHDQVEALTLADRLVVLQDGKVQQQGAPSELFTRPANTFVATFLGAPPMNLLPATPVDGGVQLEQVDVTLAIGRPDAAFTLGVRPSDITLGEGPLTGTVDVVEHLGHEAVVHLNVGPHQVLALVDEPTTLAAGDAVSLRFDTTHPFDRTSGQRLETAG
ncbi:MAG: ABC transporter ATP-binding protein [Myxococcota bacterium]